MSLALSECREPSTGKLLYNSKLRPSSILYKSGRFVLADFGLTQILTKKEQLLYTDPASEAGNHELSDIFSLAVITYELLCNHLPFDNRKSDDSYHLNRKKGIVTFDPCLSAQAIDFFKNNLSPGKRGRPDFL